MVEQSAPEVNLRAFQQAVIRG